MIIKLKEYGKWFYKALRKTISYQPSTMSQQTVIKVENLSKLYRLGEVGTGTISHDLNRWWARVRGKEDPFAKVGATQAAMKGEHVWALKDINFEVKQGEILDTDKQKNPEWAEIRITYQSNDGTVSGIYEGRVSVDNHVQTIGSTGADDEFSYPQYAVTNLRHQATG